jgi:hypothetical protein
MGFDTEDLLNGEFGPHDEVEGLAFLQSWLFFGLLREALGDRAELIYKWWVEDYDSIESGPKYMISPHLAAYLDIFAERLSNRRSRPPWEYWEGVLRTTLQVAEKFEAKFKINHVFDGYTDEPPSLTIIWSILTFGQMLSVIVMKSYRREQYFNTEQWPDSVVLDRRLAKRKWCPNFKQSLR